MRTQSTTAPEGLFDFRDGRLLVHGRITGMGQESGAAFESFWADLLTLSRGRVIREQFYFDREEARAAAGVEF